MNELTHSLPLTAALEDYLETIFEIIRDRDVARVRDIAQARQVKPGSVTPALKRLEELGMIRYERREFIRLTPEGEQAARRVAARHQILVDFFTRILDMPAGQADRDACAMEHHLSDLAMDRLVRLFEFMQRCPDATPLFLQEFHRHGLQPDQAEAVSCADCDQHKHCNEPAHELVPLSSIAPGQGGRVEQVQAAGAIRQRLLDMGMLPGAQVSVERRAPSGDPIWLKLHGYQLSIRKQEAQAILVTRL